MAVFRIDAATLGSAAPQAVRIRVAKMLRARRPARLRNSRLPGHVEKLIVVALGAVLCLNFWLGLSPISAPSATPPPRSAEVVELRPATGPGNPFAGEATVAATPIANDVVGETTLGLTLHGAWVTEDGGAAIIQISENVQKRFSPGEEVVPGVILDRVLLDQVILQRNGVRESLRLINRDAPMDPGAVAAGARASQGAASGLLTIGEYIVARPQPDSVGNTSLMLAPNGDASIFAAFGLEPGDKLIAVDNQPVGTDIAMAVELVASLRSATSATLSIERDGVVMPISVALQGAAGLDHE